MRPLRGNISGLQWLNHAKVSETGALLQPFLSDVGWGRPIEHFRSHPRIVSARAAPAPPTLYSLVCCFTMERIVESPLFFALSGPDPGDPVDCSEHYVGEDEGIDRG
jgi:hypothetical protein